MKNIAIIILIAVAGILLFLLNRERKQSDVAHTFASSELRFDNEAKEMGENIEEYIEGVLVNNPKHGQDKVKPYLEHALLVKKTRVELVAYIDHLKDTLKKDRAGGDNTDAVKKLMIGAGLGAGLKKRMNDAVTKMLIGLRNEDSSRLAEIIAQRCGDTFNDGVGWVDAHFFGSLDVVQMELSKMKYDISKAAKLITLRIVDNANSGCVFRFDTHYAMAVGQNSMLYPGDRYEASVMFCHIPDTCEYKVVSIKVEGKEVPIINGMGRYHTTATTPGIKVIHGTVTTKDQFGNLQDLYIKAEYYVVKPTAVITPCISELVAGVGRDFTVSLPLIPDSKLVVAASRGTVTASKGKYRITVNEPGPVTVKIGWSGWEGDKEVFLDSLTYMVNPAR